MYFTCFSILLILSCFVQNGSCTTNCTEEQLGAEVPASDCDNSKCKSVTIDQLNYLKNAKILATTWNSARALFVNPCSQSFTVDAKPCDNKTIEVAMGLIIKYGTSCDEITSYYLNYTSTVEADGGYKVFTTEVVGHDAWELCFPYLQGCNFIYRRCRKDPPPPEGKGYASIYVYEAAEGPKGKTDIIAAADSLCVQWDNKTVDCL